MVVMCKIPPYDGGCKMAYGLENDLEWFTA